MTTGGTVTFLFTDVVGSTELLTRLGDDAAEPVRRAHFRLLRESVSASGGQEVKNLGDGLMVAFPSALAAVGCAIAMQQAVHRANAAAEHAFGVRIGLNAGEPIRDEEDYFGTAVVVAKRLCDSAAASQIIISDLVRGLIGSRGGWSFRALGPLALKGLTEAIAASEVLWEPAVKEPAAPLPLPPAFAVAERTLLVGRERELAVVEERLAAARGGQSGVLLIAGEPGIGKSRLLREVAEAASAEGWWVLLGHAYDSEGMPPYLPFIEALQDYVRACSIEDLKVQLGSAAHEVGRIVPEVRRRLGLPADDRSDPGAERYLFFEAVSDFLRSIAAAAPSGLLLCLDDLHWADESTLLLLEHATRRLTGDRILVLVTYRDTDLDAGQPLARALEQLTRQRVAQRLDVRRLPKEEVGALLGRLAGREPPASLVEAVYGETEGNPFFVGEVFEYLSEEGRLFDAAGEWRRDLRIDEIDVPQGVRLVVGRRLERLGDECRRVLSLASAIGRSFAYELLRTLAGIEEEALLDAVDEAERGHVLLSDPGGHLLFSHELIRQTLLSSLSLPRRQRLHLRVAEALEQLHGDSLEPHLSELAEHYHLAGGAAEGAKAIDFGRRAAARAMSVFAFKESVRLLENALEDQEAQAPDDRALRCDLLLELCEAVGPAGDPLRAARVLAEESFKLAEELGDATRCSRASQLAIEGLRQYGAASGFATEEGRRWVTHADHYAAPGTPARVYADLALAWVNVAAGQLRDDMALKRRAMALAWQLGDPEVLFFAAGRAVGNPNQGAAEFWPESSELVKQVGSVPRDGVKASTLGFFLHFASLVSLMDGDRTRAEAFWTELEALAARTGETRSRLFALNWACNRAALDGNLDAAVAIRDPMINLGLELGMPDLAQQSAAAVTLTKLMHLGRFEEVVAGYEVVLREQERFRRLPTDTLPSSPVVQALLLAKQGRLEEARITFDQLAPRDEDRAESLNPLIFSIETTVLLGDRDACEFFARKLKPVANVAWDTSVARLLGAAAALLGKPDEARAYFAQALEACEKIRYRPEVALTRFGLAELLLASYPGERDVALEHLDFAISEFEAMKMAPSLARALALRAKM